jgi:hypothetical protein
MNTQTPGELASMVNAASAAILALKPGSRHGGRRHDELRKLVASVAGEIEGRLAQGVTFKEVTECFNEKLGMKIHHNTLSKYYKEALAERVKADSEAAARIAAGLAGQRAAKLGRGE